MAENSYVEKNRVEPYQSPLLLTHLRVIVDSPEGEYPASGALLTAFVKISAKIVDYCIVFVLVCDG